MYNLIEYSDDYLKILECLWQLQRDDPELNDDGTLAGNFPNRSVQFKYKQTITGSTREIV